MRSFRRIPLADFAEDLGVSRDTARRLFQRHVLPEDWVEKSPGGKWFILIDEERLPIARDALRLWKGVRRRPRGSKAFYLSDLIGDLAFDLFQFRLLGRKAGVSEFPDLERGLERGGAALREIEEELKTMSRSPEGAAILLVTSRLIRIRERFGDHYVPTAQELAEWMNCSVATLYRSPYGGKQILKEAQDLLDRMSAGGSVESVERLAQSGGEMNPERICRELAVTFERARDLYEAWRLTEASCQSQPEEPIVDPWVTNEQRRPEADFWDPDSSSSEQSDESAAVVKKKRDRKRARLTKKRLLLWEFDPRGRGALYLSLIPERAYGIVKRYRETVNPKVTETSFASARAQVESGREGLGCVFAEKERYLRRVFDEGITPDCLHDSVDAATASLLDQVRQAPGAIHIDPAPDWEALEAKAVHLWSLHTQPRGPSIANKPDMDT